MEQGRHAEILASLIVFDGGLGHAGEFCPITVNDMKCNHCAVLVLALLSSGEPL